MYHICDVKVLEFYHHDLLPHPYLGNIFRRLPPMATISSRLFATCTPTDEIIPFRVLWATGEMTCSFFVICMPCLAKIIMKDMESSLLRRIRRRVLDRSSSVVVLLLLGSSTVDGDNRRVMHRHKLSPMAAAKYRGIDDNDSKVQVSQHVDATRAFHITKTTHITMQSDPGRLEAATY